MNDERPFPCRMVSVRFLCCLYRGYEYRNEFFGLSEEWLQFVRLHDPTVSQQFQPINCFLQFLQSALHFADELSPRPGASGFPMLGANGGSASEKLFAEHLRLGCPRERRK